MGCSAFRRRTGEGVPPGEGEAGGVVAAALLEDALGEGAGGFDKDGVVHEDERLQGRAGFRALGDAELAGGGVEGDEGRIDRGAPPIDVALPREN